MHHEMGLNTDGGGLVCDCGHGCADLAAWHVHTARTYNNPGELAVTLRGGRVHAVHEVEPGTASEITGCTKVACYEQGNSRACWTVTTSEVNLYGLPSEQAALDLVTRGGVIATTYLYSTC